MGQDDGRSLTGRATPAEPVVSALREGIANARAWRTDSPDFGQCPIWQYVWIQGEQYHSGHTWFRQGWGIATIRVAHADDHYRGYRQSDIEAICERNGIDFNLGPVIVGWLPAFPPVELDGEPHPSIAARSDGEYAATPEAQQ